MSNKGGLFVTKKEMVKVWVDGNMLPVTLVTIPKQEIVRYKTQEKDGYSAVVIGVDKKTLQKTPKPDTKDQKGVKVKYRKLGEFTDIDDSFVSSNEPGKLIDSSVLDGVEQLTVIGISKGKGFQGAMKRFNLKGGPKTHGSKFHRQVGSMGNRKPRRTQKGHPHAGRMGTDQITLKNIKLLDVINNDNEQLLVLKGSLPGHYNSMLQIIINN